MNSFGRIFRIGIYGESHGPGIGITIDGCPAGMELSPDDFGFDLDRRKAGRKGTTPRIEKDTPEVMSGVFNGMTTGSPINLMFRNSDVDSSYYDKIKDLPRPGHADFAASKKFGGFNDYRGGGHFSGRLTLPLVAAGVIAKKIIKPLEIRADIIEAGGKELVSEDILSKVLDEAIEKKDSIGAIVECKVANVPIGLGEPFFDSVESLISHIVFSIPAIKGIEFGSGFGSAGMNGSDHNDQIIDIDGNTLTNNAGGINGGITNGNELVFRCAVKPTSSISLRQETVNTRSGEKEVIEISGRHDVCIALRVPPVLEAAAAIVLADLMLREGKIPRVFS